MMAVPASRRMGVHGMAWEWVPGVIVALVGNALTLWKGAMDAAETRGVNEEKIAELRRELDRHEEANEDILSVHSREFRESSQQMHAIFTEMKVLTSTQTQFNVTCTQTLQGVAHKLEYQDSVLIQHTADIAVLKSGGKA